MKSNENDSMEVDFETPYYEVGGLPWIPSYSEPGVYVAPGGGRMHELDLVEIGAECKTRPLWRRHWVHGKKS